MLKPFRNVQNRWSAARARARAQAHGEQLCAVLGKDGRPRYFTVSPDASDLIVARAAFEAREGRVMEPLEHQLFEIARTMRGDT